MSKLKTVAYQIVNVSKGTSRVAPRTPFPECGEDELAYPLVRRDAAEEISGRLRRELAETGREAADQRYRAQEAEAGLARLREKHRGE